MDAGKNVCIIEYHSNDTLHMSFLLSRLRTLIDTLINARFSPCSRVLLHCDYGLENLCCAGVLYRNTMDGHSGGSPLGGHGQGGGATDMGAISIGALRH